MANPKEKTPMCLVNELARFHSIQPQYKLLSESGPAHSKMFSVQLSLGEQTWESEGSSIKKAQQAVANKALTESTLPKPVQKPPKSNVNNNPVDYSKNTPVRLKVTACRISIPLCQCLLLHWCL
uniref:Staufen double-stranded RNA binding protein 2 n=1 Tax=Cricetulus griseus TaxID=10029 RepID=A0A8C2QE71_CRIGR